MLVDAQLRSIRPTARLQKSSDCQQASNIDQLPASKVDHPTVG